MKMDRTMEKKRGRNVTQAAKEVAKSSGKSSGKSSSNRSNNRSKSSHKSSRKSSRKGSNSSGKSNKCSHKKEQQQQRVFLCFFFSFFCVCVCVLCFCFCVVFRCVFLFVCFVSFFFCVCVFLCVCVLVLCSLASTPRMATAQICSWSVTVVSDCPAASSSSTACLKSSSQGCGVLGQFWRHINLMILLLLSRRESVGRLLNALHRFCGSVLDPEKHRPAGELFSPKVE